MMVTSRSGFLVVAGCFRNSDGFDGGRLHPFHPSKGGTSLAMSGVNSRTMATKMGPKMGMLKKKFFYQAIFASFLLGLKLVAQLFFATDLGRKRSASDGCSEPIFGNHGPSRSQRVCLMVGCGLIWISEIIPRYSSDLVDFIQQWICWLKPSTAGHVHRFVPWLRMKPIIWSRFSCFNNWGYPRVSFTAIETGHISLIYQLKVVIFPWLNVRFPEGNGGITWFNTIIFAQGDHVGISLIQIDPWCYLTLYLMLFLIVVGSEAIAAIHLPSKIPAAYHHPHGACCFRRTLLCGKSKVRKSRRLCWWFHICNLDIFLWYANLRIFDRSFFLFGMDA